MQYASKEISAIGRCTAGE